MTLYRRGLLGQRWRMGGSGGECRGGVGGEGREHGEEEELGLAGGKRGEIGAREGIYIFEGRGGVVLMQMLISWEGSRNGGLTNNPFLSCFLFLQVER